MNSISDLTDVFGAVFSLLWNSKLLGVPILFWFVLISLFGIIGGFIKGKK